MLNEDVNSEIKLVQKQFLCAVPISSIQWLNVFDNISWENQEKLYKSTIDLELVRRYPLKISYQRLFLKHIISELEKQESDVNDCLFDAFGQLVTLVEPSECFKHYSLETGLIITLQENTNIISQGTTGLCSWQASLALSEWCIANETLFKDKVICELGSGIGLTGLTLALNCQPKKLFLSDYHPAVTKVLCHNIELNTPSFTHTSTDDPIYEELTLQNLLKKTSLETVVEVLALSWEDVTEKICNFIKPDILLAADVIYDSTLFPFLINAISRFLRSKNTKELIIACTERNRNTLDEFLTLLEKEHIYKELPLAPQKNFIWSTECPLRIFSVKPLQS